MKYLSVLLIHALLTLNKFPLSLSSFDYDVSARVQEKIVDFLTEISRACIVPTRILKFGTRLIENVTFDPRTILYPTSVIYSESIDGIYICLRDGSFYFYGDGGQRYEYTPALVDNPYSITYQYNTYMNGSIMSFSGNYSYYCKDRPWYQSALLLPNSVWSEPYLNYGDNIPVITLSQQLSLSLGTHSIFFLNGVIAADIYLSQLNQFLVSSFAESGKFVYIVDRATLFLLGTSSNISYTNGKTLTAVSVLDIILAHV